MRRHDSFPMGIPKDFFTEEDALEAAADAKKSLISLKSTLAKLGFEREWIPRLEAYVGRIAEGGAVFVLLFGSRAKGDFGRDSDIDLLIVHPGADKDVRNRPVGFFCDGLPVQPFVLTREELEERIKKLDFLVFDAFGDGIVLYSVMDVKRLRALLQETKERFRLERVKNGWRFDAAAVAAAGI